MRLLARNREQRFPSATAALEALTAKTSAPVAKTIAEAPPVPAPELKPRRKRSGSAMWVIAVILIGICLGIWAGLRYLPPMLVTAVPALSPGGGTYAEAQPVAISDATPFSTIYYTMDGSQPTEASPVYTQPITGLPSGSTIHAMATTVWGKPSLEASGTYHWSDAKLRAGRPPEPSAYELGKAAFESKDYTQVRTLFTQACEGGEMKACNYLGYLYAQGLGGPPDVDTARKIYQKACDQGILSSCASLGIMYQDDHKYTEARKYFKQACDGGVKEGCEYLRDAQ
jgi:hypothetical protein